MGSHDDMIKMIQKRNKERGMKDNVNYGESRMATKEEMNATQKQVAGNHYSKLAIQPMEYNLANGMNYAQANAIKYITRYKDKNGIEDLKKAIHCIELLIEFEERQ